MSIYWFASMTGTEPHPKSPDNCIIKDIHPVIVAGKASFVYGRLLSFAEVSEEVAIASGLPMVTKEVTVSAFRKRLSNLQEGKFRDIQLQKLADLEAV